MQEELSNKGWGESCSQFPQLIPTSGKQNLLNEAAILAEILQDKIIVLWTRKCQTHHRGRCVSMSAFSFYDIQILIGVSAIYFNASLKEWTLGYANVANNALTKVFNIAKIFSACKYIAFFCK